MVWFKAEAQVYDGDAFNDCGIPVEQRLTLNPVAPDNRVYLELALMPEPPAVGGPL